MQGVSSGVTLNVELLWLARMDDIFQNSRKRRFWMTLLQGHQRGWGQSSLIFNSFVVKNTASRLHSYVHTALPTVYYWIHLCICSPQKIWYLSMFYCIVLGVLKKNKQTKKNQVYSTILEMVESNDFHSSQKHVGYNVIVLLTYEPKCKPSQSIWVQKRKLLKTKVREHAPRKACRGLQWLLPATVSFHSAWVTHGL